MSNSDERREVAARLRNDGRALDAIDAPLELASLTLDDALGIDHMRSWCDVFERLADLIDPTCHAVHPDTAADDELVCSECGAYMGAIVPFIGAVLPLYCPSCGARVVEGGDV